MPPRLDVHVISYSNVALPDLRQHVGPVFPAGFDVTLTYPEYKPADTGLPDDRAVSSARLAEDAVAYLRTIGIPPHRDPWVACVLVAGWLAGEEDVNGILLDAAPSAVGIQRGACALFLGKTYRTDPSGWLFWRTMVHELGHVLNIDHNDAASGCVMKTSFTQLSERIAFSHGPTKHLLEHPEQEVRPGGMDFGQVIEGLHPALDRGIDAKQAVELQLKVKGRRRRAGIMHVMVGDAVTGRVTLRNASSRNAIRVDQGAEGGMRLRFQLRHANNRWQRLRALRVACNSTALVVRPGKSVAHERTVFADRSGMAFDRPGRYELRAVVRVDGRAMTTPTATLIAQAPSGAGDARLIRRLAARAVHIAVERGCVPRSQHAQVSRLARALPADHPVRARLFLALGRTTTVAIIAGRRKPRALMARRPLQLAARSPRSDALVRRQARHWLSVLSEPTRARARRARLLARLTNPRVPPHPRKRGRAR